jgi:hypothetical protein
LSLISFFDAGEWVQYLPTIFCKISMGPLVFGDDLT